MIYYHYLNLLHGIQTNSKFLSLIYCNINLLYNWKSRLYLHEIDRSNNKVLKKVLSRYFNFLNLPYSNFQKVLDNMLELIKL